MTTPAPGWLSDPTGRHEYRYWDGASWSSDVSDDGVTAIDALTGPLPAPGAAGVPGPQDATGVIDPTAGFPPVSGAPTGYGPPTAAYGGPGAGEGGGPPSGGYGAGGPAPVPPSGPRKSGPSTPLLVGLGVLALALIVGIVLVLTGGDDDETSTADGGATPSSTVDDTPATTLPDEGDAGDAADDPSGGLGDLGDGGDIDLDDEDTRAAIVDVVAEQLAGQGIDREQAECLANGILDGISADRLAEIGASGGDLSALTPEEMGSMMSAIIDCGVSDLPAIDPSAGT